MDILVRNITKNKEMKLELPMPILVLEEKLGKDEYIIIEHDRTLSVSEYANIIEINTFLENCRENSVDEDILAILTQANYIFEEIKEAIMEESYCIVDFTETTKNWMIADISSDSDKGLCLQVNGYADFPFQYDESMEDYIDWAVVWRDAEGNGWRTARHDFHDYLVIA